MIMYPYFKKWLLPLLILIFSLYPALANPIAVPAQRVSWVTDLTGTLNDAEKRQLENQLAEFEGQNTQGSQIAVLIVNTTGQESIEQFATDIFNQWGLGDEEENNGILLLVAKDDRKVRIEVGYGLEPVVTNDIAAGIIKTKLAPAFQKNAYYSGISQASLTLATLINEGQAFEQTAGYWDALEQILIIGFKTLLSIFYVVFAGVLIWLKRNGGQSEWVQNRIHFIKPGLYFFGLMGLLFGILWYQGALNLAPKILIFAVISTVLIIWRFSSFGKSYYRIGYGAHYHERDDDDDDYGGYGGGSSSSGSSSGGGSSGGGGASGSW